MEERLAALERALGVKMEAQLVVLAQAVAQVVTSELARERRSMLQELAALRLGVIQAAGGPAGRATAERTAKGSLADRPAVTRAWGSRP